MDVAVTLMWKLWWLWFERVAYFGAIRPAVVTSQVVVVHVVFVRLGVANFEVVPASVRR